MAPAHPVTFLALLLICATSAAVQSNATASIAFSTNASVSIDIDIDAAIRIVSKVLSAGGPALQRVREDLRSADAQIQQLVDAARAQKCISQELLDHIEDEALRTRRLQDAVTRPALEGLVSDLQHLKRDLVEAAQQTRNDSTCQQLGAQLRSLDTNISNALESLLQTMRAVNSAAHEVVLQLNVTASQQVDILIQSCQRVILQAEQVLGKIKTDFVQVSAQITEALTKGANAAITAANDLIRLIRTLVEEWKISLDQLELQIKLLLTTKFDVSGNANSSQTAKEIVMSLEKLIAPLSFKLNSEIDYINDVLFVYSKGLEIQIATAVELVNIQGNNTLNINDIVNQVMQLKQEILKNASAILPQMLKFANEISKVNNTDIENILLIITQYIEIIQTCIQNENILLIIKVLSQMQEYIRNVFENMAGEISQELTNALKSLLQNIENTRNAINSVKHVAENKIKYIVTILSEPTKIIIGNVREFIKTIINNCQNVVQNMNNTATLDENVNYLFSKGLKNIVIASNTALQYLTLLSTRIQNDVDQTLTIILQIIFNEKSQSQNYSQIKNKIQIAINNLVNGLYGIQVIPEFIFQISEILRAELNSINGIKTILFRGFLKEFNELAGTAFSQAKLLISDLKQLVQKANSININVIRQFAANISGELDRLIKATSDRHIPQIVIVLHRIANVLEVALHSLQKLPGQGAVSDVVFAVQNLIAKLINVQDIFKNIQITLKKSVQATLSSITLLEKLQVQTLISVANKIIERVNVALQEVAHINYGNLGTILRQILQTFVSQGTDIVDTLQAQITNIATSAEIEVTKIVSIIISSYQNGTLTEEIFAKTIELINISLNTWLSDLQVVISRILNNVIQFSDFLNIQESFIAFFNSIISGSGTLNIPLLWNEVEGLTDIAFLQLKSLGVLIEQIVQSANSSNSPDIKQFATKIAVQLVNLLQANKTRRIQNVVQVLQELSLELKNGLESFGSLSNQTAIRELVVLMQNLMGRLKEVEYFFADIKEVVASYILATSSSIFKLLRFHVEGLISFGLNIILEIKTAVKNIAQHFGGSFGVSLNQILQIILSCVDMPVSLLKENIDKILSEDTVVKKIVAIFELSYQNVSDVAIAKINEEINSVLIDWVTEINVLISFYSQYFLRFYDVVNIFIELSNKFIIFITGNNLNLKASFGDALQLRDNAIQQIVKAVNEVLEAVNAIPSIGGKVIGTLVGGLNSQVNSILQSIQRGKIELIMSAVERLISSIASLINALGNAVQLPSGSNVPRNIISQLENLKGNMSIALGNLNNSVKAITEFAREVINYFKLIIENSVTAFITLGQLFIMQGNLTLQNLAGGSNLLINGTDEGARELARTLIDIGKRVVEGANEIISGTSTETLEKTIASLAAQFLFNISLNATNLTSLELQFRDFIFKDFAKFFDGVKIRIIDVVNIFVAAIKPLQKVFDIIFSSAIESTKNINKNINELLKRLLHLHQTILSKVTALGIQTMRVIEALGIYVNKDLLATIRSQIQYVLNMTGSFSDIEELSSQIKSIYLNLEKALQYVQNATNDLQEEALLKAQTLIDQLKSTLANTTSVLGDIKDFIETFKNVVQIAVVYVKNRVHTRLKELLEGAHFLVQSGKQALEDFTDGVQGLGGQFFQKLVEIAQASIRSGYEAIEEAKGITKKLNASDDNIEQEVRDLIWNFLENMRNNSVSIEFFNYIFNAIDNQPNLLLSFVRKQIRNVESAIFSAKVTLENQIQITFKLIDLFKVVLSSIHSGDVPIDFQALLYNLTQVQANALHEATRVLSDILKVDELTYEYNNTTSKELLANIKTLTTNALRLAQSGNVSAVDQLQHTLEQLLSNILTVLKDAQDAASRLEGEARSSAQVLVTQLVSIARNVTTLLNTVKVSVVARALFAVQIVFQNTYDKVMQHESKLIFRIRNLLQQGKAALGNATRFAVELGPNAVAKLQEVSRACIASGQAALKQAEDVITNLAVSFKLVIQSIFENIGKAGDNITQIVITIKEESTKQLASLLIKVESIIDGIWNTVFGAELSLRNQIQISLDLVNLVKALLTSFNSTDVSDLYNVSLSNVKNLLLAVKERVSLLVSGILEIVTVAGAESGVISSDLLVSIRATVEAISQQLRNGNPSAITQLLQKLLIPVQSATKQAQNASLVFQGKTRAVAQQVVTSLLKAVENITDAALTVKMYVVAEAINFVYMTVANSNAIMQKQIQKLVNKAEYMIAVGKAVVANVTKYAKQLSKAVAAKLDKVGQEVIAAGEAELKDAQYIYQNWTTSISISLKVSLSVEVNFESVQMISDFRNKISTNVNALLSKTEKSVNSGLQVLDRLETPLKDISKTINGIIGKVGSVFNGIVDNIG